GVDFAASGGTGTSTGLGSGQVAAGNTLLTLVFNDFGPAETFSWVIDVDEASDPSVYGDEMIGALAEVDFSNGLTLLGELISVPGNSDASQFSVTGVIPEPGTAILLSMGLSVLALRRRRT
ncbi:MAG: PEP-CTERM sorting domain-containing protein, partial [Myxococcota bacterium]